MQFLSSPFESSTSVLATSVENRFNIVYLKALHKQLLDNKTVTEKNESQVIEILRIIAEMTVYGDSKNEILFDFFCEKNMFAIFLEIMIVESDQSSVNVQVQILQTLSIMVSCVQNNTSLYYLLSNNRMNQIINFPFDLSMDESLRDHYVSFLKTLSMRLNQHTINFFYVEETMSFPLLTQAIKLLSINDNMSKIAAQTIILNIYQIDEPRSRTFSLQELIVKSLCKKVANVMISYYKSAVCRLYDFDLSSSVPATKSYAQLYNHVSDILANFEDWLFYVNDLCLLNIPIIKSFLSKIIFDEFVVKFLFSHFPVTVDQRESSAEDLPIAKEEMLVKDSDNKFIAPIINDYFEASNCSESNESQNRINKSPPKSRRSSPTHFKDVVPVLHLEETLLSPIDNIALGEEEDYDSKSLALDEEESVQQEYEIDLDGEQREYIARRQTLGSFSDANFYPEYNDVAMDKLKEQVKLGVALSFLVRLIRLVTESSFQVLLISHVYHPLQLSPNISMTVHSTLLSMKENYIQQYFRTVLTAFGHEASFSRKYLEDENLLIDPCMLFLILRLMRMTFETNSLEQQMIQHRTGPECKQSPDALFQQINRSLELFVCTNIFPASTNVSWTFDYMKNFSENNENQNVFGGNNSSYNLEKRAHSNASASSESKLHINSSLDNLNMLRLRLDESHNKDKKFSKSLFEVFCHFLQHSQCGSVMAFVEVAQALSSLVKMAYFACFQESHAVTSTRKNGKHADSVDTNASDFVCNRINKTPLVILRACVDILDEMLQGIASMVLKLVEEEGKECISSSKFNFHFLEEVNRFKGKTWASLSLASSGDVNLLLSLAPAMQDWFCHLPSTEVPLLPHDAMKMLIQRFLISRSLVVLSKNLLTWAEMGKVVDTTSEDIMVSIVNDSLFPFTGVTSIPIDIRAGATFNMRGKKFLDTAMYLPTFIDAPESSKVPLSPSIDPDTHMSLASSVFGFGFLKSTPASANTSPNQRMRRLSMFSSTPSQTNSPAPVSKHQVAVKKLTEVLLVQDPNFLLLVKPSRLHGSDYEVVFSIPMFQIEAALLMEYRTKIKVVIHSWDKLESFWPDVELRPTSVDTGATPFRASDKASVKSPLSAKQQNISTKPESKPEVRSYDDVINGSRQTLYTYDMLLVFDCETTCTLALKFLSSKSKSACDSSFEYLKTLLQPLTSSNV